MDNFLGEIRLCGFNFPPAGWAFCDGSLLAISQNAALFSILGTTYGGNGVSNFALPDLRGRAPLHFGQGVGLSNRVLGEKAGVETVTLSSNQMPAHNHVLGAATIPGDAYSPVNAFIAAPRDAASGNVFPAFATTANAQMQPIGPVGSNQAHNNMPPFLCMNFIIALTGIFPPRA